MRKLFLVTLITFSLPASAQGKCAPLFIKAYGWAKELASSFTPRLNTLKRKAKDSTILPMEYPPQATEIDLQEPWKIEMPDHGGLFNSFFNIQVQARRRPTAKILKKLGIKTHGKSKMTIPPPRKLNDRLKELGSPFRVTANNGSLSLEPWLALVAEGKFPVGFAHDLESHFSALIFMPPDLGWSFQGRIAFLRALQAQSFPLPAAKELKKRLNAIAGLFEQGTTDVGTELIETSPNLSAIEEVYLGLSGASNEKIGALGELTSLKTKFKQDWEEMGFDSQSSAETASSQMQGIFQKLEVLDPLRFKSIKSEEARKMVRDRFKQLGIIFEEPAPGT